MSTLKDFKLAYAMLNQTLLEQLLSMQQLPQEDIENIKRIREAKGMTQQQVATLIGMHRSNYSKIEKGQRDISVASIVKIATHFNLTVDELLSINKGNSMSQQKLTDDKLLLVQGLSDKDKDVVYRVIDLLLIEKQVKGTSTNKK